MSHDPKWDGSETVLSVSQYRLFPANLRRGVVPHLDSDAGRQLHSPQYFLRGPEVAGPSEHGKGVCT